MGIFAVVGGKLASIAYTADTYSFTSPTTNTSWTFSGVSIGTATANRLVIVGVSYVNTAANTATVTIGGITATEVSGCAVRSAAGGSVEFQGSVFAAVVPTGSTATIVVNTGTATGCWIGVWAAYDLVSTTAVAGSHHWATGTSTVVLDLNVSPGGVACAMGITPNAVTWTGLTEDYDKISGPWTSGASGASQPGGSPLAVRVNCGSGSDALMCAVSFR